MSAQLLVLYPRTESSTFNKEYYLSTHMGLAKRAWEKHGLKSYSVVEASPEDSYAYITVLDFESIEAFGAAMQDPESAAVMADVTNFTNIQPVIVHGNVVGRG